MRQKHEQIDFFHGKEINSCSRHFLSQRMLLSLFAVFLHAFFCLAFLPSVILPFLLTIDYIFWYS